MSTVRTLTDADNGKTVTIKQGEPLRIQLVGVPTAGYLWLEREVPEFLKKSGESTLPTDPVNQNQPGFTGGEHFLGFDYDVVGTGTGTVLMHETRPWESDEPPVDTWSVTLIAE